MLQLVPELSVYATVSLSAQGSGSFYLRQKEGGDMKWERASNLQQHNPAPACFQ